MQPFTFLEKIFISYSTEKLTTDFNDQKLFSLPKNMPLHISAIFNKKKKFHISNFS